MGMFGNVGDSFKRRTPDACALQTDCYLLVGLTSLNLSSLFSTSSSMQEWHRLLNEAYAVYCGVV